MHKTCITLFFLLLIVLSDIPVYSQNIPVPSISCEGSQFADGTFIPEGQTRIVTINGIRYRCTGCGGCTPLSGSSRKSGISFAPQGLLSPDQQARLMLMNSVLQPMLNSMFSSLFSSPQGGISAEELQRQKAETLRIEAQQRLERLNKWLSIRTMRRHTDKERQKRLSSILAVDVSEEYDNYAETLPGLSITPDINSLLGNVIKDKVSEYLEGKIEDLQKEAVKRLGKKYGIEELAGKLYEKGLPLIKIGITAKTEGIESAGAKTIDYLVNLIPFPTKLQQQISEIGRKVYTKIAFKALDKVLDETEKAGNSLGFNFDKDEFMQNFENDMTRGQKIIYRWLKGE